MNDSIFRHARREILKDIRYRDARATDAGLPAPDGGIDHNGLGVIHVLILLDTLSAFNP